MTPNPVRALPGDWWPRYLPIPFRERGRSFAGCDCRGLALLILEEELGQHVPDPAELYGATDPRNGRELAGFVADQAGLWTPCDLAPFAVLSFAVAGLPVHVGVALGDGAFIHTRRGAGVAVAGLDDADPGEARWGRRLLGAYRYGA